MKPFLNIILMLIFSQAYGQRQPLTPLRIGDKMPDITIGEFRNYKTKTAKISDFKGKLLIIDFWDRWCGSCIRSFPHMENLQNQFGNKIAILLVTNDPMEAFEKLHKRSPTLQTTKLPFVIGDSALHALFPHKGVPYHVWVDPEGYVKAMTEGTNATISHIQDILDNKEVALTKREDQMDFDSKQPLIREGNGRQLKHLAYYSIIMHRLSGYSHRPTGMLLDTISGSPIGVRALNKSIIELYMIAYRHDTTFNSSMLANGSGMIVVESSNNEKYYPPANKDDRSKWNNKNTYCYEMKWPTSFIKMSKEERNEKTNEIVKQDLDRFFQIRSTIERRNKKCLILYRLVGEGRGKINQLEAKNKKVDHMVERLPNNGWIFVNTPFSVIPNKIGSANSDPHNLPVIDETNYRGNIDATFNCDFSNIETAKYELAKYGLGLKEEVRPITCLVLREVDDN